MARPPDETIPGDEALYRSISVDDVNGEDVLPQGVDLPRCSFNRSKHSKPEDVFVESRPNDNGVAQVVPDGLPPPVPRASGEPYEFFAQDDPNPREDPENDAHCEIRIKPRGRPFSKNHEVNKSVLAKAKDELARKLRVLIPPREVG